MFTGIIESICSVKLVGRSAGAMVMTVDLAELAAGCKIGDSIAVSGVCLTITRLNGSSAAFDVSGETLSKSTLGKLTTSSQVNIERAIKADGRFGGHFVLGHIDGTAAVKKVDMHADFADITFSAERDLLGQMVVKGSVAIDGISLTIASMGDTGFTVAVIPETLKKTTLGKAKAGDIVNIETDMIIKTVKKQLESILPKEQKLTVEKLRQLGF